MRIKPLMKKAPPPKKKKIGQCPITEGAFQKGSSSLINENCYLELVDGLTRGIWFSSNDGSSLIEILEQKFGQYFFRLKFCRQYEAKYWSNL